MICCGIEAPLYVSGFKTWKLGTTQHRHQPDVRQSRTSTGGAAALRRSWKTLSSLPASQSRVVVWADSPVRPIPFSLYRIVISRHEETGANAGTYAQAVGRS